jgi:hypothetical protein
VFVLNRSALRQIVTRLAGLEAPPEVIAPSQQVNSRTPPSSLFDVLIALEDVVFDSTIVASRYGIRVQQIVVGVLAY